MSIRKTTLQVTAPHKCDGKHRGAESHQEEVTNRLLNILQDSRIIAFRLPSGEPWVSLPRATGGYENHRVENSLTVSWLMEQYTHLYSAVPEKRLAENAVMTFAAKVRASEDVRPVYDRLAMVQTPTGTAVYLDLGDALHVVRITPGQWDVIEAPPRLAFRRATGFEALPLPEQLAPDEQPGQVLEGLLRPLLNCPPTSEGDFNFVRMVACLLAMFYPEGDQAILVLTGEAGSGKSSVTEVLRSLIDPNTTRHGNSVTTAEGVQFEAIRQYVPCFDNLRSISDAVSDALANVATGSGQAKRKLYTDDDIISAFAKRPIILNGIRNVVRRPDLVDRSFILYLPALDERTRRFTKTQLRRAFQSNRPHILGALLAVVAAALARLPEVITAHEASGAGHYRLGDFHMFVKAAEPVLGWPTGTADRIMQQQKLDKQQASMEQHTDIEALVTLLFDDMPAVKEYGVSETDAGGRVIRGAVGEVLTNLTNYARTKQACDTRNSWVGWPNQPKKFAQHLREAEPALAAAGIQLRFEKSRHKTIVTIVGAPEVSGSQGSLAGFPSHTAAQTAPGSGSDGSQGSQEIQLLTSEKGEEEKKEAEILPSPPSPDSPAPLNAGSVGGSQAGVTGANTAETPAADLPSDLEDALNTLRLTALNMGGKER